MNVNSSIKVIPKVKVHPHTIKYIKNGHPWVIKDSFTEKFPREDFILATEPGANLGPMIHDPTHPKIKARHLGKFRWKGIANYFSDHLYPVLKEREELAKSGTRDNFYLCFGEADFIPGLFILSLGKTCIIQTQCKVWEKHLELIKKNIQKVFHFDFYWHQQRKSSKEVTWKPLGKAGPKAFTIQEFGVNYQIRLDKWYDFGIYTDMSAIRSKLEPVIKESKRILNLYCYTGAYSLFAMKYGCDVTSVDLSFPYLKWLEENIKINDLEGTNTNIKQDCIKAMQELVKNGQEYDLIICDPPTASSDGKKMTSALDRYKELIPLIDKLLAPQAKAIVFLNTHSVSNKKFREKIDNALKKGDTNIRITESLRMSEDCPSRKGFMEGDYLKGLVLQN